MTIRAGILTVSDKGARGERVDTAGPAVGALLEARGAKIAATTLVPDDEAEISSVLVAWSDDLRLDVVLTVGGTGLSLRDQTPEATLAVVDRLAPGIAELMRDVGRKSTPLAALSRAVAGTRGRTLIVNLPGSERGARESLASIIDLLPHAVDLLQDETTEHPVR